MLRRSFLKNVLILTGGVIAGCSKKTFSAGGSDTSLIRGSVTANGKGLADVIVSDGYSVVATDAKGKYELLTNVSARHLFISTPGGYAFPHRKGISSAYKTLNRDDNFDFSLEPLATPDDQHQFIIWADPQVRNADDVEKMMAHSVPDVQKLVAAAGSNTLIHGITVGDIAWDDLKLFADYNVAVEKMGIPFFQCLGNHDMDYRQGGDETSDKTFQAFYGPTYYSFNRGQVHYVVLDDVRYLGTERDYDGHISQQQLDWLKKDLSFVPMDKLIILCLHIPVHLGVKNKEDLYAILGDRPVHIMSGHTHWHDNVITGNIYEHNHGTVCGAWWTGAICGDGTPNGYGVYKVNGNQLSWHYQSTGKPADHQFNIFVQDYSATQQQVIVNIWNYDPAWKTEYLVDGVAKGALEQFEGYDPTAYASLLGPDLPKPRGFAEPKMTNHLFRAFVPASAHEITVVATDRFGKKYSFTQKV